MRRAVEHERGQAESESEAAAGPSAHTIDETHPKHHFTTGSLPPVHHGFHDPGPSASDQAFGSHLVATMSPTFHQRDDQHAGSASSEDVTHARSALDLVDPDRGAARDERRQETFFAVIRQILEKAGQVDYEVANELLTLVDDRYKSIAVITNAVANARDTAEKRKQRVEHTQEAHHDGGTANAGPASTWQSESWAPSSYADPSYVGVKAGKETTVNAEGLMAAFTKVAPHLPHSFKVMLVGHAMAEQKGGGVFNYNFGGIEGHYKAVTEDVWTSDIIDTSEYKAHPSKYRDWDWKNHPPNPRAYVCNGHPAGTIAYQLAMDPVPPKIGVMVAKDRPAYETLEEGAAAFVHEIERRIHALQLSAKPQDVALAQAALDGDAAAYGRIMNNVFYITGTDHKPHNFGAFNGDKGKPGSKNAEERMTYADRVEQQINSTRLAFPEDQQTSQ